MVCDLGIYAYSVLEKVSGVFKRNNNFLGQCITYDFMIIDNTHPLESCSD